VATRHIHLEPIGGVAGDMLAAALLDAFPEAWTKVEAAVQAGTQGEARAKRQPWRDHTLAGLRFEVVAARAAHEHRRLADIEALLAHPALAPSIRGHALSIFRLLAEAEGTVHGIAPAQVTFHEVGALDSIADIVAAAALIDHLDGAAFTITPLPLGSGRIETAHGTLPVPPPAVVELLRGFVVRDDGIAGERVTPTGAAILRHLAPICAAPPASRLLGRGLGFGTKRLPGISNVLRVLVLEPVIEPQPAWQHEEVALITFEVDDQSPEDLALGLDRVRAIEGVLDVLQIPVTMKKGRLAMQIQVIARPEVRARAIAACFDETTTLGLRYTLVERAVLPRRLVDEAPKGAARVKLARRPGGQRTAKTESDDLAHVGGRKARETERRRAAAAALAGERDDD